MSRDLRQRIEQLEEQLGERLDLQRLQSDLWATGTLPSEARKRRAALDVLECLGLAAVRTTGDETGQRSAWWCELLQRADGDDPEAVELLRCVLTQPPQPYRPAALDWVPLAPKPLSPPPSSAANSM